MPRKAFPAASADQAIIKATRASLARGFLFAFPGQLATLFCVAMGYVGVEKRQGRLGLSGQI